MISIITADLRVLVYFLVYPHLRRREEFTRAGQTVSCAFYPSLMSGNELHLAHVETRLSAAGDILAACIENPFIADISATQYP